MKKVSVYIFTALFTIVVFTITAFVSCVKPVTKKNGTIIEPCKNVVCYNGGTCVDGVCQCPAGFSGANCSDKWNDAYVGTYEANDQCDITNKYFVTIGNGASNNASEIVLNGISKFCPGITLQGTIQPNNSTVNFAQQRFCDYIYVSGTATQSQDKSFINVWLSSRDSNAHITTDCSIILRKL